MLSRCANGNLLTRAALSRSALMARVGVAMLSTSPRVLQRSSPLVATASISSTSQTSRRRAFAATFAGLTLSVGAYAMWSNTFSQEDLLHSEALDTSLVQRYIPIEEGVSPFPTILQKDKYDLDTDYVMLGCGTRYIELVTYKVYCFAVYIATEDKHLIKDTLSPEYLKEVFPDIDTSKSHSQNVREALADPERSLILINKLLESKARMAVKFTPIRTSNITFVREGIIKSVWAHPWAKLHESEINNGVDEFRKAFKMKGNFIKNEDLILELRNNGGINMHYHSDDPKRCREVGTLDQPMIGRYLFSQYMSGPKPLSKEVQEAIADTIASLV